MNKLNVLFGVSLLLLLLLFSIKLYLTQKNISKFEKSKSNGKNKIILFASMIESLLFNPVIFEKYGFGGFAFFFTVVGYGSLLLSLINSCLVFGLKLDDSYFAIRFLQNYLIFTLGVSVFFHFGIALSRIIRKYIGVSQNKSKNPKNILIALTSIYTIFAVQSDNIVLHIVNAFIILVFAAYFFYYSENFFYLIHNYYNEKNKVDKNKIKYLLDLVNVQKNNQQTVSEVLSCNECDRCQVECPAYYVNRPLSPKHVVRELRDFFIGKAKDVSKKELDYCVECRACTVHCPNFVDPMDKIIQLQSENNSSEAVEENNSKTLTGISSENYKKYKIYDSAEVLIWNDCKGKEKASIRENFFAILDKANIRYAVIDNDCCCQLDKEEQNISELYNLMDVTKKTIVTICPHCFDSINSKLSTFCYKNSLLKTYKVENHISYLFELMKNAKIKNQRAFDGRLIYHDACKLGRFNSVYEEPRTLIKTIPFAKFSEAKRNKEYSFCCGGGKDEKIARERLRELLAERPDYIVTSCFYCQETFKKEIQSNELKSKVKICDITEILNQSI